MATWDRSKRKINGEDMTIVADKDSTDEDPSIMVTKGVSGILVVAVAALGFGIWKGKRWLVYAAIGLGVAAYVGIFSNV